MMKIGKKIIFCKGEQTMVGKYFSFEISFNVNLHIFFNHLEVSLYKQICRIFFPPKAFNE